MFGRTLGGLFFVFGTGAASAQLPIPDVGSSSSPVPVQAAPAPNTTGGYEIGSIPSRVPSRVKTRSAFDISSSSVPATQAPAPVAQPPAGMNPAPAGLPGTGAGCTDLTCSQPCPTPCCVPCCYPPGRVWANAEWLYWATSGQSLPPLVTGSNTGGTGALVPGNTLLYGNSRANNDFRNGLRLSAGAWFDECHKFGIEGDFLYLGNSSQGFAANGTGAPGTPLIARPFFNQLTGLPDSELVAVPGSLAGTVTATSQNSVIGGGFNFRRNLCCTPCGRVDLLLGYRYFNVTDDIVITEDLLTTAPLPPVPAGFRFQIRDHFRTVNNFNGGVIGLAAERRYGILVLGARASVALGNVNEVVYIDGATTSTPPGGAPTTLPGGLLTQTTNIGRYERNQFAVMPELGLKIGVQLTENIQIYGGYNFIYLSNVARAGDQIDLHVNPNFLPPPNGLGGPAVPAFHFKATDFYAQGVSAGVRLSY
ncbi:MAG: BBP7 family outer membrane beta-barrel protein [Planctomycetes bacterium]|nr:BBP7 family outer membrane beta-barrel protein [Planctomycetota bacterium]